MKTSKSISVNVPVSAFLRNAYFSPYHARLAAQAIFRDYNTYKDLYIRSVDIFNRNGKTFFNINFSNYYDLPPVCTAFIYKGNCSFSAYDFRCLRNYFKSYSAHGNH